MVKSSSRQHPTASNVVAKRTKPPGPDGDGPDMNGGPANATLYPNVDIIEFTVESEDPSGSQPNSQLVPLSWMFKILFVINPARRHPTSQWAARPTRSRHSTRLRPRPRRLPPRARSRRVLRSPARTVRLGAAPRPTTTRPAPCAE